jgi:hypothetical protein
VDEAFFEPLPPGGAGVLGGVKLLLETHVLLWALLAAQMLSLELHNALEDSDNRLLVSFCVIRVSWIHTSAERCCFLTLGSYG